VQFEITEVTRQSVERFLTGRSVDSSGYLFPSRLRPHISTRKYARIVHRWIKTIGLDDRGFGMHSLRRTKVAQHYRKIGNLRAVQLLLGHAKIETTIRYLGVEVDDASDWRSRSSCSDFSAGPKGAVPRQKRTSKHGKVATGWQKSVEALDQFQMCRERRRRWPQER